MSNSAVPPVRVIVARELKRAPVAISAVSDAGVFEGYASLFGVVDLGRDLVLPGAFRETLARRGPDRVKMLWQHEAREPIGAWLDIAEDARGLRVKGRLNLAVTRAREVLALMREGTVDGLSIGYRTEKAHTDRMTGIRRLQKIDLWEISVVTFPMLPQARVSSVKWRPRPAKPPAPAAPVELLRAKHELAACSLEIKFLRLCRALEAKWPGQPRDARRRFWFGRQNDGGSNTDANVHLVAGGSSRRAGGQGEGTPAQQARLALSESRRAEMLGYVQRIDPAWRPPATMHEGGEGRIAANEADIQAARARLDELRFPTYGPGPWAGESIPARGPGRDFTREERDRINEIGRATGCHTCGTREPGTVRGNFYLDHQGPNRLLPGGDGQRLYPHCIACSGRQGNDIMRYLWRRR